MAHGVTLKGFSRKTLEQILAEIEAEERASISVSLNTSAATPIGQINGIFATKLSELWELAQGVYGNFDPAAASATALDSLAALTGTARKDATFSLARCAVTLDAGTYPARQLIASVEGNPGARFVNRDALVIPRGGVFPMTFVAESPGPVQALARTLTVIAEPVVGWRSVTNLEDADEGRPIESDVALRMRRAIEVAGGGADSLSAIRAHVSRVKSVDAVTVIENFQDVPVAGLPPKSFEVVISDGTVGRASEDEVAQAIWQSKPAGIEPFGSITATAIDVEGDPQTVRFSRVQQVPVWIELNLIVDGAVYQDNNVGVAQAIVEFAEREIGIGDDVILEQIRVPVFSVPGVVDVIAINAGFTPTAIEPKNLTIEAKQIAVFDTGRIIFDD